MKVPIPAEYEDRRSEVAKYRCEWCKTPGNNLSKHLLCPKCQKSVSMTVLRNEQWLRKQARLAIESVKRKHNQAKYARLVKKQKHQLLYDQLTKGKYNVVE